MHNNKTGQRIPITNIEWIGIIFYLLDQWHI